MTRLIGKENRKAAKPKRQGRHQRNGVQIGFDASFIISTRDSLKFIRATFYQLHSLFTFD
jgi:hypothetical protein